MSARYYANAALGFTGPDGRPTMSLLQLLRDYERRMAEIEARLDAVAAVAGPSGGATVDAQARTAIAAIISGAA